VADTAETGRLTEALTRLLPHVEEAWRYDGPEIALRDRDQWMAALGGPMPRAGVGMDQVLDELSAHVIPYGTRVGKPGFSGYIVNGPTTTGVAASFAATATSPHRYLLTSGNHLEALSLLWLQELIGVPAGHQGLYSAGGSVANLIGLGAARQAAYEARGRDASADGIDGPGRIYTSSEAHHTVGRSAAVLGLGRRSVFGAPVDDHQRVDVDAITAAIDADREQGVLPVAIVGTAGTTNTGAIDPLDRLADLAEDRGVWLHVDGAYGLLATTVPELAPRFAGVERADSVIIDPHKWLCTPIGIAASFVRDADLLYRAFTQDPADYLEGTFVADAESPWDDMGVPYADFGIELTSPARGVVVWAMLRELGVDGVQATVRRDVGYARRLADRVEAEERLELLTEPELSIVCFRYVPDGVTDDAALDDLNAELLRVLRRDTPYVPSSTKVRGRFALRPCYINPRTTEADVDGLADAVLAIGASLA
jgi:aromatic-L-amino-acid/L-tryptophan decarboxylase